MGMSLSFAAPAPAVAHGPLEPLLRRERAHAAEGVVGLQNLEEVVVEQVRPDLRRVSAVARARDRGNPSQVWANLLHDDLFEILEADDALRRMRAFSTEKWLERTVSDRGRRGSKRERHSQLQRLLSRPVSTRFG